MVTIGIDPGHGGADAGAIGMGYQEKDLALQVGLRLRDLLQTSGVSVVMSRDGDWKYFLDQGADLSKRAAVFNAAGCDAVISIHLNSAGQPAWGVETYTWDGNNLADAFGDAVHAQVRSLNPVDRGRKRANFAILRETDAVACLVEMSFINSDDVNHVVGHIEQWAQTMAKGIRQYFGLADSAPKATAPVATGTIKGKPSATVAQAQQWARTKGAAAWFVDQAPIFWQVASAKGVDPAGVYAQSALETGFGRFGGVLDESFFNPCGLKTTIGGGDYEQSAHTRFADWREGITAQVDHLLLYAGEPQHPTPDPRHFEWLSGTATTWKALGGKWAPSSSYGEKITAMMAEMATVTAEAPPIPPVSQVPEWAVDTIEKAKANGFIDGQRLAEPATRLEMALVAQRVYEKLRSEK